jgi:hypothetical protein
LDHCLTHSQQSLCRSKSSSALLITASQKLRQLGNIHRNPPRLVRDSSVRPSDVN